MIKRKLEPLPHLLKVREVGRLLSVSRCTVYELIDCGDLVSAPVGPSSAKRRHLRITRESLCAFYEKRFGKELEHALGRL